MHFSISKLRPSHTALRSEVARIVPFVFLILAGLNVAPAITLPPLWRWSNPYPHGADVFDMAASKGTYVQVGGQGQIFVSEDLQLWVPRDSHTNSWLRAVTFFGGRIVITGENGTVLFSDNGEDFFLQNLNTSDWLVGVAASPARVVAVGDNGAIYTSTNAVTWQRVSVSFNNWLTGVAYGANTFVTVGERGFIATSQAGTTWTTRSSGTTTNLNRIAWVGDRFLAVGEGGKVLWSTNGSSWTTMNTGATNTLYAVAGTTNSYLIAGEGELRMQVGMGWSNQLAATLSSPAPNWSYYSALWDGSDYYIAGGSGMVVKGTRTNNAALWVPDNHSIRTWLWGVTRTPSHYLAVGYYGSLMTSPNGIDWDVELTPAAATNAVLLGVGGSTNLFLAAGTRGTILWATNIYLWNALSASPTTNDLEGILYDGAQYLICGGNGTLLASTNGFSWTRRTTPTTEFLMSMAKLPSGWVAAGSGGVVLTSTDSISWARQSSATTNWLSQVRYLGGTLVAVGENGTILTSTNGTNWITRNSGTTSWLNAVDYYAGAWFVVGNQGTGLVSTDLTNWVNTGTITYQSLYGLTIHNGQMIAVGSEGVIIRSQLLPASSPVKISSYSRAGAANVFLFSGEPDQRFYLNTSTNLSTWSQGTVLEFFDSTGTLLYLSDAVSNSPPSQFFRTVTSY